MSRRPPKESYSERCARWGREKTDARMKAGVGFSSQEAKDWSEQYNAEHPYPKEDE